MTARDIIYGIAELFYVALFLVLIFTLRGIRRDIKRIADRLYWPVDEEAPKDD